MPDTTKVRLPVFKVGQVWQCRDQRYTAKVAEVEPITDGSVQGSVHVILNGQRVNHFFYANTQGVEDAYFAFNGPDPRDLVRLLFDPDGVYAE